MVNGFAAVVKQQNGIFLDMAKVLAKNISFNLKPMNV